MSNAPNPAANEPSPARSLSTTAAVTSAPSGNGGNTADPDPSPLRPGVAAKRILEAEDAEHRHEPEPPSYSLIGRLRRYGVPALHYLFQTEVHTYAFSFAANALLAFFPFYVLLLTVTRRLFHSLDMYNIILQVLRLYLPSNQDFVVRNLQFLASVKGKGQLLSLGMLLVTSAGVFLPLEVALNNVWGFKKNRPYLSNWIVSLGLAFGCGVLGLLSVAVTANNLRHLGIVMGDNELVLRGLRFVLIKATGIVPGIAIYFLIYWLLPNGRVPVRAVLPAAIIMALLTEVAKSIYTLLLPWLNFQAVYGPFSVSVTMMMWAYTTGMLLLLGAYLSAAQYSARMEARQQS